MGMQNTEDLFSPKLSLPDISSNNSSDESAAEPINSDNSEAEIKKMESSFTSKELAYIESFCPQIDIMDRKLVLQYGNSAQSKIAKFSDKALKKFQNKGFSNVVETIAILINKLTSFSIDNIDFNGKSTWKIKRMINNIRSDFISVSNDIDDLVDILEEHILTLMQDVSILEKLYKSTTLYFKELSMYILAGKKRLFYLRKTRLVELSEKAKKTGNPEDIFALKDFSEACDRFEKKIQDLQTSQAVAMQMSVQTRLLQNSDSALLERIQETLDTTIPLWKSQMLIALGLANSANALHAQQEATRMTDKLIRHNSEKLKHNSIEVAKKANRGIIDIETLKNAHQQLIDTITDIQKVQEDGRTQRNNAETELHLLEEQMKRELSKF